MMNCETRDAGMSSFTTCIDRSSAGVGRPNALRNFSISALAGRLTLSSRYSRPLASFNQKFNMYDLFFPIEGLGYLPFLRSLRIFGCREFLVHRANFGRDSFAFLGGTKSDGEFSVICKLV
jgi:hypothetical protein